MNKLSILTVLSLVAFAATYEYDFTIGLSDQYFDALNATVALKIKNSRYPAEDVYYKWKVHLVSNSNQTVNTGNVVGFKVEEFTEFKFRFDGDDRDSSYSIKLRDFYLVPRYLKDPATIAKQTIRICPPEKHQSINSQNYVELKRNNC